MRNKMREQLDRSDATHFDLKQGAGGIVDLEFIVQFAVLAWSHEHANLMQWTDNIRILEQLVVSKLISAEQAEQLMEAYRVLRGRGHRRTLLGEATLLGANELLVERELIQQAWKKFLSKPEG
jgi:glutamate-ammonia-ligase adenylyltransferase